MSKTKHQRPATETAFLIESAQLLANLGRHHEARAVYQAAIESDSGSAARNEFGCFLCRIDCFSEAIGQFSMLLEHARRTKDESLRSVSSNNLAAVYRQMDQFEQAAVFQQQSIAAERPDEHESCAAGLPCDLTNRALDAMLVREYQFAETLLRRSLSLEIESGSLAGQAADWGNLGVLSGLKGDHAKGIICLWQALKLHRKLKDHCGVGSDLMNLAELFRNQGRGRAAIACLRSAVRRFEKTKATESAERARRLLRESIRAWVVLSQDPLLN